MTEEEQKSRMDIIWAPWRMAYVTSDNKKAKEQKEDPKRLPILPAGDPGCFICQGAVCGVEELKDRLILRRTKNVIVLLNRFPYNNGHLLVAPKRHISRLDLLTPEEWKEISDELTYWVSRLEKEMNAAGFNVGLNLGQVAGAGLPGHLHWHIVPRWNGDTNFVTTIGSTKAIPQSLESLQNLLADHN